MAMQLLLRSQGRSQLQPAARCVTELACQSSFVVFRHDQLIVVM